MSSLIWISKLKKSCLMKIAKICKLKKYSKLKKRQIIFILILHYSAIKIQKLKKNGKCPFTLEPVQHPFYKRTTLINKKPHAQFYNLEPLIFFLDLSNDKYPCCPVSRIPFSRTELQEIRFLQKKYNIVKRPNESVENDNPDIERHRSILDTFIGEITNLIVEYEVHQLPYRAIVRFIEEMYIPNINNHYTSLKMLSRESADEFVERTQNTILQEPPNELREYFLFIFRTLNSI